MDAKWREIEDSEQIFKQSSENDTKAMVVGAISISEEEFRKLNASKHAVKVPPKLGGGFMALPEFVHQVHCVVRPLRDEKSTRDC